MKKSFFSRFKDKLNMDYGGRYFALLLREIIKEEPSVNSAVFPSLNKSDQNKIRTSGEIHVEYPFPGFNGRKRRADLAILIDGKIEALLEVKYEDEKNKKKMI